MSNSLKEEMLKDYPLVRMADITDEARLLSVAWHENATNWIGDKHKLASDIMNYARRVTSKKDAEIAALKKELEEKDKRIAELVEGLDRGITGLLASGLTISAEKLQSLINKHKQP